MHVEAWINFSTMNENNYFSHVYFFQLRSGNCGILTFYLLSDTAIITEY